MTWDMETRASVINGRLSRLDFLAACSPFLFMLDWMMNHQFHSYNIRIFILSRGINFLLVVLCMFARGRWRDYGSRVDVPLFFLVFEFLIFILAIVNCIFYNVFVLFMMLFVIVSVALPSEDVENDFGLIPETSMLGCFIAFPFAVVTCIFVVKLFFQSLFLKTGC